MGRKLKFGAYKHFPVDDVEGSWEVPQTLGEGNTAVRTVTGHAYVAHGDVSGPKGNCRGGGLMCEPATCAFSCQFLYRVVLGGEPTTST